MDHNRAEYFRQKIRKENSNISDPAVTTFPHLLSLLGMRNFDPNNERGIINHETTPMTPALYNQAFNVLSTSDTNKTDIVSEIVKERFLAKLKTDSKTSEPIPSEVTVICVIDNNEESKIESIAYSGMTLSSAAIMTDVLFNMSKRQFEYMLTQCHVSQLVKCDRVTTWGEQEVVEGYIFDMVQKMAKYHKVEAVDLSEYLCVNYLFSAFTQWERYQGEGSWNVRDMFKLQLVQDHVTAFAFIVDSSPSKAINGRISYSKRMSHIIPLSIITFKKCWVCHREPHDDSKSQDPPKIKVCGCCNLARYCSQECQKLAWKQYHKYTCKSLRI